MEGQKSPLFLKEEENSKNITRKARSKEAKEGELIQIGLRKRQRQRRSQKIASSTSRSEEEQEEEDEKTEVYCVRETKKK